MKLRAAFLCCWRICLVCLALELVGPCVVLDFSVGMDPEGPRRVKQDPGKAERGLSACWLPCTPTPTPLAPSAVMVPLTRTSSSSYVVLAPVSLALIAVLPGFPLDFLVHCYPVFQLHVLSLPPRFSLLLFLTACLPGLCPRAWQPSLFLQTVNLLGLMATYSSCDDCI